ncbi:MAG: nucleoside deaminase [Clostridia bacterium]|nr:nucleoside deaminase [Clostridia bacterium]
MDNFMFMANELAKQNVLTNNGGPFGAIVVKDGVVVGCGNNRVLSSNDPTAHAEVMAIRDACKTLGTYDLTGCELYTSCYPCPMCLSAIVWANIRTVYYGNTSADARDIGFRDEHIYDFIRSGCSNGLVTLNRLKSYELPEDIYDTFVKYAAKYGGGTY